jgi:hypothetical protein
MVTVLVPETISTDTCRSAPCYDHGMKKLIVLSLALLFSASAFAQPHHRHHHHAYHHHRVR